MDNLTKILQSLVALVTVWVGGYGFKEFLKGRNERSKEIREARLRIIQDAKWLIGRLDSTSYSLMGDFRKDMHFLAVSNYLSVDLSKKVADLIPSQNLASDCDEKFRQAQIELFDEIVLGFKKSIVDLESNWLSNPRRRFSRFRKRSKPN